jgi:hypothetical protein
MAPFCCAEEMCLARRLTRGTRGRETRWNCRRRDNVTSLKRQHPAPGTCPVSGCRADFPRTGKLVDQTIASPSWSRCDPWGSTFSMSSGAAHWPPVGVRPSPSVARHTNAIEVFIAQEAACSCYRSAPPSANGSYNNSPCAPSFTFHRVGRRSAGHGSGACEGFFEDDSLNNGTVTTRSMRPSSSPSDDPSDASIRIGSRSAEMIRAA